jgi:membrane protease YdiL (CAAX protease family)
MATWLRRAIAALRRLAAECRRDESMALLLVTLILVTREALASPPGQRWLAPAWSWLGGHLPVLGHRELQGQAAAVILQSVPPVVGTRLLHRRSLREVGLGLGDLRFWLPIAALILAIQVAVIVGWLSRDPTYAARYPSFEPARQGGALLLIWEGSRVLYMFSWEFMFRGYLLLLLERRLGMLAGVVQMVPFALMHLVSGKPISEVYFTVVSGLLSAVLVIECRSVWPVVLLHAGGAVLLDLCLVLRRS